MSEPQLPGLEPLKSELLQAQVLMTQARTAEDSREAAKMALRAVVDFVEAVPGWERLNLSSPISTLLGALQDLDHGRSVLMLTPNPAVRNRKRDATTRNIVKGYAVFGIDFLRNSGLRITEACRLVAREVERAGISLGNRPTTQPWKLVKGWRDRMTKLPVTDQARNLLEEMRREHPAKARSPEAARAFVTAILQECFGKLPKGALE